MIIIEDVIVHKLFYVIAWLDNCIVRFFPAFIFHSIAVSLIKRAVNIRNITNNTMKLESVSEDQNSYSKHNGKEQHTNGATDDEKAILVSKEAITTKTLGKLQDEKAKCLDVGNKLNGLSYKGKDGDEYELIQQ